MAEAKPKLGRHIAALDGVRGLAILMVLVSHYRDIFYMVGAGDSGKRLAVVLEYGGFGVDLFFVLSGFLITGILLDSIQSRSFFSTFYMRRVLRIFPLYFAYLFLVFVVIRAYWQRHYGLDRWASIDPWWYITYFSNWKPNRGANEFLLTHLWSLAVEEQFYLVWPMVVFFCPRRPLAWICAILAIGALPLRFAMLRWGCDVEDLHRLTPARMDTLLLGALLAIAIRDDRWRDPCRRLAGPVAVVAAMGLLAVFAWPGLSHREALVETVGWSLIAVLSSCLIYWAAASEGTGPARSLFCSRPMKILGKYSYGIYVLHLLVQVPFSAWRVDPHLAKLHPILAWSMRAAYMPFMIACSVGLAWISWTVLERPFLKLKDFFPYRGPKIANPPVDPSVPLVAEGERV